MLVLDVFQIGFFLPNIGFELQPEAICLIDGKDYSCAPLCLALIFLNGISHIKCYNGKQEQILKQGNIWS
jgi:hypothetical protein